MFSLYIVLVTGCCLNILSWMVFKQQLVIYYSSGSWNAEGNCSGSLHLVGVLEDPLSCFIDSCTFAVLRNWRDYFSFVSWGIIPFMGLHTHLASYSQMPHLPNTITLKDRISNIRIWVDTLSLLNSYNIYLLLCSFIPLNIAKSLSTSSFVFSWYCQIQRSLVEISEEQ